MRNRLAGPLALAATLLLTATTAQARNCGARADVVERLQTGFGETRTGAGLTGAQGMIEVFASEESGTWTIILTKPSGESCLLAAGENWESGPGMVTQSGQPA